MRRASPTGTGTPAEPGRRWTATGIAGAAAVPRPSASAGRFGRETMKTRCTPRDRVTCGA